MGYFSHFLHVSISIVKADGALHMMLHVHALKLVTLKVLSKVLKLSCVVQLHPEFFLRRGLKSIMTKYSNNFRNHCLRI